MKYTKLKNKLEDRLFKGFFIGLIIFVVGLYIGAWWCFNMMKNPILGLMFLSLTPLFGIIIHYSLAHVCGDEAYSTGLVMNGQSVIDFKKTPRYFKRKAIVCFIMSTLTALSSLNYTYSLIIYIILPFRRMIGWSIFGIIVSVVLTYIIVVIGLSSLEQSKKTIDDNDVYQNENISFSKNIKKRIIIIKKVNKNRKDN